jgi:transcriptional regulator with XRE-family HTH domain
MTTVIGETLQRYRGEHGLTREQLAVLLGVSAGTVYVLEKGRSLPSVPTLRDIAQLIGMDASAVGALVLSANGVSPAKQRRRFVEAEAVAG